MKKSRSYAALLCAALYCCISASGCSKVEELPAEISSSDSPAAADQTIDNSRYIYNQLSDKEREYYDIIKDAAVNFKEIAVFPEAVDPEVLRKLYISVYFQEEELFWLSSMFYRPASASETLALSYRFTKDETDLLKQQVESKTAEILSSIEPDVSDYEKLRAFHDHLVLNCTFSMDTEYANTIYGALCDGYAQCEGYAFAFDYLCRQAGIDCFTVPGTNSEGASHAWNIVRLEDNWYNVDCTWDDPILSPVDTEFVRHYYFLAADSDISGVTHFTDNTYYTYPICSSTDNYYKREGYFASSADEGIELLKKSAADALNSGRKDAAVRFANESSYKSAVSKLFDNGAVKEVFKHANNSSERKVTDKKYIRYLNEDELIIHISMIYD